MAARFGIDRVASVGASVLYDNFGDLLVPVDLGHGPKALPLCKVMCEAMLDTTVEFGPGGRLRRLAVHTITVHGFSCQIANHGSHYQGLVMFDLEGRLSPTTIAGELRALWGSGPGRFASFWCDSEAHDIVLPFHAFEARRSSRDLVRSRESACPQGETAPDCHQRLLTETARRDHDAQAWCKGYHARLDRRLRAGELMTKSYKSYGFVRAKLRKACRILRGLPALAEKRSLKDRIRLRVKAVLNRAQLAIGHPV